MNALLVHLQEQQKPAVSASGVLVTQEEPSTSKVTATAEPDFDDDDVGTLMLAGK